MCGILGQITFADSRGIADHGPTLLAPLLDRMARRGPDDRGIWSDGRYVTFAHRRLAILDLSLAGHQPMLSDDGRYAIVYNGELYNYRELRRELEFHGQRFRSTGDTEVVLYALVKWGVEALARFNGMFALGFYDGFEKQLTLARDHAGIKPIYYAHTTEGLFFASQYDQVLDHAWMRRSDVSRTALGLYLRLGYIPAPYALMKGSHMLEPGAWLSINCDRRLCQGRFFDFPICAEPTLRGKEAEEAVDAAVTASVRRQLVGDVGLGTFLSGGIDSPLVTAKASELCNHGIRAFTIGTQGDRYDESVKASSYAKELGVEHFIAEVAEESAIDLLDDAVAACGEPFADYSIFPTLLASRLARQHVKVVLSGDGGDELFWGYPHRHSSLLIHLAGADDALEPAVLKELLLRAPSADDDRCPRSAGEIHRLKHTHGAEPWLHRVFPDLPAWPVDFSFFSYSGRDVDKAAQWLRWSEFGCHLAMVLLKVDRGSMFHSLEVRTPLLDREVIDIATRVDWQSCLDLKRNVGKLPLRHLLARHVGKPTLTKKGFSVPMEDWLRGPLRGAFEELVLSRKEILNLALNRTAAREIFERHLRDQANFAWLLWTLLSLVFWEERYLRGRKSAALR